MNQLVTDIHQMRRERRLRKQLWTDEEFEMAVIDAYNRGVGDTLKLAESFTTKEVCEHILEKLKK